MALQPYLFREIESGLSYPGRTWETRSQVVAADRGVEFAFLPDGITRFHDRFGDDAEAQIASRTEAARSGIPITLAALKKAAEAG
jgi:hypothetical protein